MPSRQDPPLYHTSVVQRKASSTFGTNLAVGAARGKSKWTFNRLRSSTPDFLSGFTPVAFTSSEVTHKAVGTIYCSRLYWATWYQ